MEKIKWTTFEFDILWCDGIIKKVKSYSGAKHKTRIETGRDPDPNYPLKYYFNFL